MQVVKLSGINWSSPSAGSTSEARCVCIGWSVMRRSQVLRFPNAATLGNSLRAASTFSDPLQCSFTFVIGPCVVAHLLPCLSALGGQNPQ